MFLRRTSASLSNFFLFVYGMMFLCHWASCDPAFPNVATTPKHNHLCLFHHLSREDDSSKESQMCLLFVDMTCH